MASSMLNSLGGYSLIYSSWDFTLILLRCFSLVILISTS
jgi:hypothetical protein